MERNNELITILAVTYLNLDTVNLIGITDEGKWIRILNFNSNDLYINGKKIKPFNKVKMNYIKNNDVFERHEDRAVYDNVESEIQLYDGLNPKEQKALVDKFKDDSISGIINNFRSIGMIKPIINEIQFEWNPLLCNYEVRFTFEDEHSDKFNFLCKDLDCHRYWVDFLRREPLNVESQLLKMKWNLNEGETYFVVGFTKGFDEIPGPFSGKWPLILGVHSI